MAFHSRRIYGRILLQQTRGIVIFQTDLYDLTTLETKHRIHSQGLEMDI